jgi:IclR family transcriptional regulator, KDG regulon repressor
MEILQLVNANPQGLSLSEICQRLEMPKSSTHELLHAMEQQKFLQIDGKRYKIGIRIFELGQTASRNLDILRAVRPHVKWLSSQSSMTTQFGILEKTEVIYLSKITSHEGIAVESQVGARMPAHATALGKAMLSLLPDEVLETNYESVVFEKFTPSTIASTSELRDRLNEIRDKKFAEDHEEFTKGVFCLSVPVPALREDTIGAISISMPKETWKQVERDKLVEKLHLAGTRIRENMKETSRQKSSSSK